MPMGNNYQTVNKLRVTSTKAILFEIYYDSVEIRDEIVLILVRIYVSETLDLL